MIDKEKVGNKSCDQYIAVFPPFDAPDTVDHFGDICVGDHYRQLDSKNL